MSKAIVFAPGQEQRIAKAAVLWAAAVAHRHAWQTKLDEAHRIQPYDAQRVERLRNGTQTAECHVRNRESEIVVALMGTEEAARRQPRNFEEMLDFYGEAWDWLYSLYGVSVVEHAPPGESHQDDPPADEHPEDEQPEDEWTGPGCRCEP